MRIRSGIIALVLFSLCAFASDNAVMGTLQFEGKTKVEKTSGVWVDGQYVGFLKELKGSKKVMLLPGDHDILVRQSGYQDFRQKVTLQPGQTQLVTVMMSKAMVGSSTAAQATVKIEVKPDRAAVFVDDAFAGHVAEFQGIGRGMLIAPGPHHIRIALPGYTSFETDINPVANQKVEVKTELARSAEPLPDPLLKGESSAQPQPQSTPPSHP